MNAAPQAKPSLLENPWYWVYLFCTAGLIALVLMGPKFASRQTQLEQNLQGRDRAAQQMFGDGPTAPVTSDGETAISLTPLYIVLGLVFVLAWVMLWRNHFRRQARESSSAAHADPMEAAP